MPTIKINRRDMPNARTPILTYCRALIAEGHDPATRLEVFRERAEPDLIVRSIGEAAQLTVLEDDKGPPRFVPYRRPIFKEVPSEV